MSPRFVHRGVNNGGRKRTHLWLNEANDCTYDDWYQLIFRTCGRA